nr:MULTISPECIES: hypothetical protein [unclassified Pseudomonas]
MKDKPETNRPIDRLRDSAGSLTISTPDDDTPIRELISTDERLLIVKDKAIYEIALADQIDPERTNPAIPNTIQKILSFGATDSWVGAVILTSRELFLSSCFDSNIGRKAFNLTLEIAQDIAGAKQILQEYSKRESESIESVDLNIRQDRSFVLPAAGNVETTCNEYLQRVEHAFRELFKLAQLFYPDVSSGTWDSLKAKIDSGPQDIDNFSIFLESSIGFPKLIKNARNCVEHPRPDQRIVVNDFRIDQNNNLVPPTIEVVHSKTPMSTTLVKGFFESSFESLVQIVELMVVFLSSRHAGKAGGFQVFVMELTPEQRKTPHVRYGFGLAMGDKLVPIS